MATKTKKMELASSSLLSVELVNYHERIHRDNFVKMTNQLEPNHPIKLLADEQRKISHIISLLEKARDKFSSCGKFECATVEQWELIDRIVQNLRSIDRHFHNEESYLFPELVEYGFAGEVRQILIEHRETHRLIDNLISAYDNGMRDNYHEISKVFSSIGINLAKEIRLLHHRENHILYPRILRVVAGQNSWRRLQKIVQTMRVKII